MNPKLNHLAFGLLVGIIIPIMAYGVLLTLYDFLDQQGLLDGAGFSRNFRDRTTALLAICANIACIQYFTKRYASKAMRGVLLATFLLAAFWIFHFNIFSL